MLFLELLLAFSFIGCGKSPTSPSSTEPPGSVLGQVLAEDTLASSRLVAAGCVQVVKLSSGEEAANFSTQDCPPDSQLLPPESTAFSLRLLRMRDPNTADLYQSSTPVGALIRTEQKPSGFEVWKFVHLCQISDPESTADGYYAEVCQLHFGADGRYQAIRTATIEALARSKSSLLLEAEANEGTLKKRISASEWSAEKMRRDRDKALVDRQESQNALAEAQRGVRDSMASNLTVQRSMERARASAEMEYALREMRYLELRARFAKAEQKRAALLQERLDAADSAKSRDVELRKQIEELAASPDADPAKVASLKMGLEQNRLLLLEEDDRRKIQEETTFALAESKQLTELEQEKIPAALKAVIQKKDAVGLIDRLSP
jgi:hypothetical protein